MLLGIPLVKGGGGKVSYHGDYAEQNQGDDGSIPGETVVKVRIFGSLSGTGRVVSLG